MRARVRAYLCALAFTRPRLPTHPAPTPTHTKPTCHNGNDSEIPLTGCDVKEEFQTFSYGAGRKRFGPCQSLPAGTFVSGTSSCSEGLRVVEGVWSHSRESWLVLMGHVT